MLSKDAVAVASLVGGVLILRLTFAASAERIEQFMAYCITMAKEPFNALPPMEILMQSILLIARVCGPLLGVTILLTLVATMAQTRMLVSFELVKPKFDKINPLNGFKNLFSLKSLVEVLKNTIKISILLTSSIRPCGTSSRWRSAISTRRSRARAATCSTPFSSC